MRNTRSSVRQREAIRRKLRQRLEGETLLGLKLN